MSGLIYFNKWKYLQRKEDYDLYYWSSCRRSTHTSVNVLVYMVREKHAYMDFIGVFPHIRLRIRGFIIEQATFKIASSKMVKDKKTNFRQ